MTEAGPRDVFDPLLGLDIPRLEAEMDAYHDWLDQRADDAYQIATKMRKLGLDHTKEVEIPRASDLASRTEKLLIHHLEGEEVADDIRALLAEHDRETTSIRMGQLVAKRFKDKGHDLQKSIDVGLRVGLAILTEAVLVAPLEGISEVRLLANVDGSQFLSIYFAGPIRAAGGTAQALAVLIADMIRRELGVDAYVPTQPEVERVKEEFGLYRGNLQYRPTPEEIESIVKACPIMINGESTEAIECAGYGRVRNIDEPRIRGGVLLVIGEGLCLKAPKIQKHTERLEVTGWEFISKFANKGKDDDSKKGTGPIFKSRKVPPIKKFMKDIIAGRPVFGAPLEPGGFRLRYGRARPSGLAAGSCSAASMAAMDDFITVGTQMKIERPGKACAITPCDIAEGPWVLMSDGEFKRIDDEAQFRAEKARISMVWDNGELVLGYGEFMENNKNLVPAGYAQDWWAADLLDALDSVGAVNEFCQLSGIAQTELPEGVPGAPVGPSTNLDERFHIRRKWRDVLHLTYIDWTAAKGIALRFGTSLPSPHNPWWLDLPIEWVPSLLKLIGSAEIKDGNLIFKDAVKGWNGKNMENLLPEQEDDLDIEAMPGPTLELEQPIFATELAHVWVLRIHGIAKGCALMLGLGHHHQGNDLFLTQSWQALLDGLGFSYDGD
ncbi:MAG TPA: hypothetical protein EYG33_03935, partial [Candidatus Poseidoniales archaeon]|nr:hypothetical protein [Candidatus Poseidoniales archaeon]